MKNNELAKVTGLAGSTVATVLSYSANHSIGYAVLHWACGWFYVAYFAFCK